MSYKETFKTRWADIDANGHMRHSAYNDYAAHLRVSLFDHYGFPMKKLIGLGVGPVLFREETLFMKELPMHAEFTVDCEIAAMRKNGKLWKIVHHFTNDKNELLAQVTVDGGWMDLKKRRIVPPPEELLSVINDLPKSDDFQWLEKNTKN